MILEVQIQIFIVRALKTEKNIEKKLVDPQKRAFLSFKIKTVKKNFSSYLSFVFALETIDKFQICISVFVL